MKPPFIYFGAKVRIAERIAALLPPHEHYVEPFAGSLSVLLAKPPSLHETVNDLDGDLMNFWRVLRDYPTDLERACRLTPHSRAEYLASYDLSGADDLERARRIWVRLTQGRGGSMRITGWRGYINPANQPTSMPNHLSAYVERAAAAAARLAQVSLECKPASELIRQYGAHPGVLIYADPPYLGGLRIPGPNYAVEMRGDEDHRELLETLLDCRAAVMLSGYTSPLYDDLLCTWFRREIAATAGNGNGDKGRSEVLWSNRPFPQGSLFDPDTLSA